FIQEALQAVSEASQTTETLKRDVCEIERILRRWERNSLFERTETRTLTVKEFEGRFRELKNLHEKNVRKDAQMIHEKMDSSFKALKDIEKDSKAWKDYIQYVNSIVIQGISKSILVSLQGLRN